MSAIEIAFARKAPVRPREITDHAVRQVYASSVFSRRWGRQPRRPVPLRSEQNGKDRRFLDAHVGDDGSLVISGQDLGPATAAISSDGEYEWSYTFPSSSVSLLLAELGGTDDQDILDVLKRRYTGQNSHALEAIIRGTEATIPRQFWSWSG